MTSMMNRSKWRQLRETIKKSHEKVEIMERIVKNESHQSNKTQLNDRSIKLF